MASKLKQRDKALLDGNLFDIVGNKPYENGKWGTQEKDFVYLEVLDNNGNLIEYTNLPVSEFVVRDLNVEFYPGTHLRNLGFESGNFTVRYNFLRKLAGDESAVLLHTVDKNDTKIGDVYTNMDRLYITNEGLVYNVTEEEYRAQSPLAEQLAVEDLKYQIDEISPSRTEVRLKAKKINSSYIDDFVSVQTKNKFERFDEAMGVTIQFVSNGSGDLGDSKVLRAITNSGNPIFRPQMLDGTINIPEVFEVDEIEEAVRSGINVIDNPSFEELEVDSQGNIKFYGDREAWDTDLHQDAVKANSWQTGFRTSFGVDGIFDETVHIGYHSKIVQNEGFAGGTCIKFTDTNELFVNLPEWPTDNAYRTMVIGQFDRQPLSSLGVKANDLINIKMDIKSTVPGKGVSVAIGYPYELITEDFATLPNAPEGYYDPENPTPTEEKPTTIPQVSSPSEPIPPGSLNGLMNEYFDLLPRPYDYGTGQTSTIWGGLGEWIITDVSTLGGNTLYTWEPNESVLGYTSPLTSPEGQWEWNGTMWIENLPNSEVPPIGTVNNLSAVNHHPFVIKSSPEEYIGKAYYPRTTYPGLNRGWQTGTFLYREFINNDSYYLGLPHPDGLIPPEFTSILIKDDLAWITNFDINSNASHVIVKELDVLFPDLRTTIVDTETNKTLYDDIFENGFIQSITRDKDRDFIIFYNNGDLDNDGSPSIDSNKWFALERDDSSQPYSYDIKELNDDGSKVLPLSYISNLLNSKVLDQPKRFEVTFNERTKDGGFTSTVTTGKGYVFFVGDEAFYTSKRDSKDLEAISFSSEDTFSYGANGQHFTGLGPNLFPHVMIGYGGAHRGDRRIEFNAITQDGGVFDRVYLTTGFASAMYEDISNFFYQCGEVDTGGDPLTYGVRNPAATNFGRINDDGSITPTDKPLYDSGTPEFDFETNPLQIGALSPLGLWKWNGYEWLSNQLTPLRYRKKELRPEITAPVEAGVWESVEVSVRIPGDWEPNVPWTFYVYGNARQIAGQEREQGIVWIDNIFVDFTYNDQSETVKVLRPYRAQIKNISDDGKQITVDKSFKEKAIEEGQSDVDDSTPGIYDLPVPPDSFNNFYVTYFNLNPKDLRTYLKFDNQMFLTTNFKQDLVSVSNYPNSVVYKMYEPLPSTLRNLDECIIVKEMANPIEEKINIVDFVPEEEPRLVLRTAYESNPDSPIRKRASKYKTQSDILTVDKSISTELRNEFLSQSLDSVEINTDYSRYENFVNFSSVEKRIFNFKTKLENIESYKVSSASYVGVSGSASDLKFYHGKILETKNTLDDFERYMYFESSSYQSGSLGVFYDNSWPKTSGDGTKTNPYVLATTTSPKGVSWFRNAITSASLYDNENNNRLSSILPEFIKFDESNKEYLTFTDMIGQHFDHIWEYVNALSDVYDRRDKLDEGLSKDLLYNVGRSLGWTLNDGKDLVELPRYTLGKEVSGSAYSDYSAVSEKDISREIWGRIVNNMPFFLKNKGTVRALKGLINVYGIPSTILRIKEYGGPNVPDYETPQFEITRKFTKALDFRGSQFVKTTWANDGSTGRKPDTIEFRFRAVTGSNQILVQKKDPNNQDFFIRLKDNGSSDNYGFVSFMMSGSKVGVDQGQYKEITSSALPVYDGDFYSVMVARTSGSDNTSVSQSYQLNVGKYDSSRSKIHLYSTSTMDVTQAASSSFSNAWTGSGDIYIGGQSTVSGVGARLSGSIMEYRHWTETLNTGSFRNHIGNPKAYDGNSVSSSYNNLVLRYSFDDNKNLASDSEGIRDVSSNQTNAYSGSHSGFTGNFFRNVVDQAKTHIPSIGALRRTTNKVRIENNPIKRGEVLDSSRRATNSAYDTAPNDSNKVGIWFAPTDVINNDIINSVGDLNFENYLGDPRDKDKLSYRGLNIVADNYWKKYTAPNNFWDYIRLLKYYDQSLYPQLRKMIPARAKSDIGLLIEPNIFERSKVILGKKPDAENRFFSSSINVSTITDSVVVITGSYNQGSSISNYEAYDGNIKMVTFETGSSVISASGEILLKEASGSEVRDSFTELSIWQRLGKGDYSNVTMSFGDTLDGVKGGAQPFVSGSRIYRVNQKTNNFYTSSADALIKNANSSSFEYVDLDNFVHLPQALRNSFYYGVKNTIKTTADGKSPVEVIISAPTKLVTTEEGDSTLTTGDGIVPNFKEGDVSEIQSLTFEEQRLQNLNKNRGLKGLTETPISDQTRRFEQSVIDLQSEIDRGVLATENNDAIRAVSNFLNESNDGIDDGVLNNEK